MGLSIIDNQVQAMNLAFAWGMGKPRGGAEASAFRIAINATGIAPRHVCALSGWFGGVVPESELPFFNDGRTSLETACKREGFVKIDLVAAIAALNERAPLLMALLYVKATAKHEAGVASVQLNKAQAQAQARDDISDALDAASRAVTDIIKHPAKIADVIRATANIVSDVQVSAFDLVFAAIPGGRWTAAAAVLVALVGGGIYLRVVMRL